MKIMPPKSILECDRWIRWQVTDGYGNPQVNGQFMQVVDAADDGVEVGILRFFREFPNGARVGGRPDQPFSAWEGLCFSRES